MTSILTAISVTGLSIITLVISFMFRVEKRLSRIETDITWIKKCLNDQEDNP